MVHIILMMSTYALMIKFSELKAYIVMTNRNFIHRIDINRALSSYRLQTPLSNLKNAYRLDYHYR